MNISSNRLLALGAGVMAAGIACAADAPAPDPQVTLTLGAALVAIVMSGAFGGLVDGLRSQRSYQFRFGNTTWEWGSVGDALVGVTAAVAIFAFAANVFGNDKISGQISVITFLKIIAWGVISGYAGTRMLDSLTTRAIAQMIETKVAEQVKSQGVMDEATKASLDEAQQLVTRHLQLVAAAPGMVSKEAETTLVNAQRKYLLVLKSDPANVRAEIGLANVHCSRGEYLASIGKPTEGLASLQEAIKIVTAAIKRDPAVAKAHYNRACYKALAGATAYPKDDAAADLLAAIELDEHLKEYAVGDKDLESLHGHKKLPFLSAKAGATAAADIAQST